MKHKDHRLRPRVKLKHHLALRSAEVQAQVPDSIIGRHLEPLVGEMEEHGFSRLPLHSEASVVVQDQTHVLSVQHTAYGNLFDELSSQMSPLHHCACPCGQIPVCLHSKHVRLDAPAGPCSCGEHQISTQSRRAADAARVNQPADRNKHCTSNTEDRAHSAFIVHQALLE